ncbi:hypothetical protein [Roseiterribacter gracilis]|uniref:hypothetical protein n=1 Tax=Roseiterribacter gracilis TaxID=2812848 RepID=UPI003B434810
MNLNRGRAFVLAGAVLFAACASADAAPADRPIAGQYEVQGRLVGQQQPYKGIATVERAGATYKVTWQVGKERYVGTGLLDGDAFAVIYAAVGATAAPGLVLYRIQPDGSLLGSYTSMGAQTIAPEAWLPGRGN